MAEGGAFAESGAPQHAKEQNVVENVKQLAEACRAAGIPVIHVHYVVEEGAPGLKLNAPLFQGVKEANALVRGTWGAAAVDGLEPQPGDFVVEKMRMSGWQGTKLELLLGGRGRQGLRHGRSGGRLFDDERGLAQRVDQLRAPERLHGHDVRRRARGDRRSRARVTRSTGVSPPTANVPGSPRVRGGRRPGRA